MQQLIIATAVGISLGAISVAILAFLTFRSRERAFLKVSVAYERIIAKADDRVDRAEDRLSDYLDRDYASRNLPPGGVDMIEEHKEKRQREAEAREERRNGQRTPGKIGVVDQGQDAAAKAVASGKYSSSQ